MRVRELARYHVRGDVSLGSLVDKLARLPVAQHYGRSDRQRSLQFISILGQARVLCVCVNTRKIRVRVYSPHLLGLNSDWNETRMEPSLESSSEARSVPERGTTTGGMLACRASLPPSQTLLRALGEGSIYDRARIPGFEFDVKAWSEENIVEKKLYSFSPRLGCRARGWYI